MDSHKYQRLKLTFPNSGVVRTELSDPELIAALSPSRNSRPALFSFKIVHRPGPVFELINDSEPIPWLANLKTTLEMPPDALMVHLLTRGAIFGLRWQNYYLRYIGIVIEQAEQSATSSPILRLSDLDGNDFLLVQVWYQRASTFSPVYSDIRWHPKRGEEAVLTNTGGVTRWRDVRAAFCAPSPERAHLCRLFRTPLTLRAAKPR